MELRLGRLRLELHWSFFVLLCAAAAAPNGLPALGLAAGACHELGHLAAMRAAHMGLPRLRLGWNGGALSGQTFSAPGAELAALLAGAGVNLALAAAFRCCDGRRGQLFSAVNLLLGGFNLLPVLGLDGGSALLLLLERRLDPRPARRAAAAFSALVLGGLWAAAAALRRADPRLALLPGLPAAATWVFLREMLKN